MRKNQRVKFLSCITLTAAMAIMSITAFASNESGKRPGPPPEAIDACKGKEVGDAVTFSGRNGEEVKAVCKDIHGQIVAFPDNPPQEDRKQ